MDNYQNISGGRTRSINDFVAEISGMKREEIYKRIRNFRGRFKLDFTEDYLNNLSMDRLRHILLAALTSTISKKLEDKTK